MVSRSELTNADGAGFVLSGPRSQSDLVVLDSPSDLIALASYYPTPADESVLRAGHALVLAPDVSLTSRQVLLEGPNGGLALPAEKATGPVQPSTAAAVGVAVLKSRPLPAGTVATVVDYRIPAAAARVEAIRAAALNNKILPSDVRIDLGPMRSNNAIPMLTVALGVLMAISAAVFTCFSSAVERRRSLGQVSDLGMRRREVAVVGTALAALPMAAGLVAGFGSALLLALVRLRQSNTQLVVPWGDIGLVLLVIAAGTVIAALSAAIRRVL